MDIVEFRRAVTIKLGLTAKDTDWLVRQIILLIDSLDIEKELNTYSPEEADGWFKCLEVLRRNIF